MRAAGRNKDNEKEGRGQEAVALNLDLQELRCPKEDRQLVSLSTAAGAEPDGDV